MIEYPRMHIEFQGVFSDEWYKVDFQIPDHPTFMIQVDINIWVHDGKEAGQGTAVDDRGFYYYRTQIRYFTQNKVNWQENDPMPQHVRKVVEARCAKINSLRAFL
jgi:hypothetical protein